MPILLLESFYNYRTVGERFDLMTSVVSNQAQLLNVELRDKKKEVKQTRDASDEVNMVEYNVNSNASNLILKHMRINAAFQRIKEKLQVDTNNQIVHGEPLFDYLMNEPDKTRVNNNENNGSSVVEQKAKYCRYQQKGSKQACSKCESICKYTIETILDPRKTIGQVEILKELHDHHHPTGRLIKNGDKIRQRTTAEAAEELVDHYVHFHEKIRPKS